MINFTLCKRIALKCGAAVVLAAFSHSPVVLSSNCELEDKRGCPIGLYAPDSFRFDNDLFHKTNDDRNYTFGLFFGWKNNIASSHYLHTEQLQKFILDRLSPTSGNYDYGLQMGLTAFSPDDLSSMTPATDDRPYSSLLFLHSDVYKGDAESAFGVGTTFGVLGLSVAEFIQSEWHALLRNISDSDSPKNPEGWGFQISDGGEITGKLELSYHRRLNLIDRPKLDITYAIDGSLGYYTRAGASVTFRRGVLDKELLPHHANNLGNGVRAGVLFREPPPEKYIFVSLKANYVAYNALLRCQRRDAGYCLNDNQVKKEVFEGSVGFSYPLKNARRVDFALSARSPETRLENSRTHGWGSLTYSWR